MTPVILSCEADILSVTILVGLNDAGLVSNFMSFSSMSHQKDSHLVF